MEGLRVWGELRDVECPAIFGGRGEPETQADGGVNVM